MIVWANGELVEAAALRIAPDDRGFLLGDGVFDTFGVRDGAPLWLDAHLARLRASAAVFGIPVPFTDDEIETAARTLAAGNGVTRGAGRLTLSRGAGQRGLLPPDPARPFALLAVAPAPAPVGPLRVLLSDIVRSSTALSSRWKTLSYIDNVEARRRASIRGCGEALLLNERGEIACASAANVFWIEGETLFTPSLDCGVLAGVTRARLLQIAKSKGVDAREGRFGLDALRTADALFLTNSVAGVVPVASLVGAAGERHFDAAGALAQTLKAAEALP
jgi:branched-subunit amino acid aminotransferase/4-amino-4-deoxychorismate lyase